MRLCVLTIAIFVRSLTVCEIITYELPKLLSLSLCPWKWRSRMVTIWMKTGWWTYLINMHMYAKICASRSCRFFAVNNHTFCGSGRTNAQTKHAHTSCQHNIIPLCRDSVKRIWEMRYTWYQQMVYMRLYRMNPPIKFDALCNIILQSKC